MEIEIIDEEYLYHRYNEIITKYIIHDNYYIDTKTGIAINNQETLLLGKTSKHIIDLIEVGDYVNGECITHIYNDKEGKLVVHGAFDAYDEAHFRDKNIKTVVTKEQFKSIEYEV